MINAEALFLAKQGQSNTVDNFLPLEPSTIGAFWKGALMRLGTLLAIHLAD